MSDEQDDALEFFMDEVFMPHLNEWIIKHLLWVPRVFLRRNDLPVVVEANASLSDGRIFIIQGLVMEQTEDTVKFAIREKKVRAARPTA